jgi:2-polyprenyl-3-methyl-5-hydroxy-6-metoxy-1,4-benzoquinol methylase
MSFEAELAELGKFWERIDFPNGKSVGPGRNKKILWENFLDPYVSMNGLKGKSILDIGCNAGGNLVELSRVEPKRLVGLEANDTFLRQAKFVMEQFDVNAEILKYKISPEKTEIDYASDLGEFDVIFCLGVIYHLDYRSNLEMLKYVRNNCRKCYFSTQLFSTEKRPNIDWSLTKNGTKALFLDAGFEFLVDIYEKKETDDWAGLTNQWYFEAVW